MKKPSEKHLHFAVLAADVALCTVRDNKLLVRLVSVKRPPHFPNHEGLPGGLIDPKETAEEAVMRLIRDKANISLTHTYIEQLYTFSEIDRDPRGRVVAVAYLALVPWETLSISEQEDTNDARWAEVKTIKGLAYDHDSMLRVALARLRSRITYTTLISKILPKEFTLTELEHTYECILGALLDKRNFRKKILKLELVKPLNKKQKLGRSRPAELYSFSTSKILDIEVL